MSKHQILGLVESYADYVAFHKQPNKMSTLVSAELVEKGMKSWYAGWMNGLKGVCLSARLDRKVHAGRGMDNVAAHGDCKDLGP